MKVLVLILYSPNTLYDSYKVLWESYMNKDPRFTCYFYYASPSLSSDADLSGNNLIVKGNENYDTIWEKTYKALHYFRPRLSEFDYVFRPNISSAVLFDRYYKYLETLPRTNLLEGRSMIHEGLAFPSGAGFTMSPDVVMKILDHNPTKFIQDDVTIGSAAAALGIHIKHREYTFVYDDNIERILETLGKTQEFHYRCVSFKRFEDLERYKRIVTQHYGLPDIKIPPNFVFEIKGVPVEFYRVYKQEKETVSEYFVDKEQRYFFKHDIYDKKFDLIRRESHFLSMLKDMPWAPKLLWTNNKDYILTEYIGEPLNAKNIPADAYTQAVRILEELHGLGITHNDIKPSEILVKDGKLYLVDYGWSKYKGELSAGIGLYNGAKPYGDLDDCNMLAIINKIKGVTAPVVYKDPRRKVGSQSEVPHISVSKDGISVSGYQHFKIDAAKKITPLSKVEKYTHLQSILGKVRHDFDCESLMDIGCNAGIVSLLCHAEGYKKVVALDHDKEYLELVSTCVKFLGAEDSLIPKQYSFGDPCEPQDVVLMISLLHWVFSCTALFGSFDEIYKYLKTMCKKVLCVEWIDTHDKAISVLGHIKMNKTCQKEEYTKENFLKAFGTPEQVIHLEQGTRFLYIFKINP